MGGDSDGCTARQLADAHVMDADLVLTMTRPRRREVLTIAPRALALTIALVEAADLLRIVGGDGASDATTSRSGRGLAKTMSASGGFRESLSTDDIADPIGQPVEAHQDAGGAMAGAPLPALERLVAVVRLASQGPEW